MLGSDLAKKLGVQLGDSVGICHRRGPAHAARADARGAAASSWSAFSASGSSSSTAPTATLTSPSPRRCSNTAIRTSSRSRSTSCSPRSGSPTASRRNSGPDYVAHDWQEMNKSLFSALWLEKMAMSITIGLIVMVAALNIIASLVLLVMEKTPDIAILKTMGSSAASIRRIFMFQGLVIGTVGTVAGARRRLCAHLRARPLSADSRNIDVYQISHVPFSCCRSISPSSSWRRSDLLHRDDLPVAAGLEARSGAGAAVSIED